MHDPAFVTHYIREHTKLTLISSVVIGNVNGQIEQVFKKISSLHAKNAFALAVIAGDLFANPSEDEDDGDAALSSLLNGHFSVPLPTYFALGHQPLPKRVIEKLESNGGELCENLYYLGKRTTVKTSEGFRVIALGGALDEELTVDKSKDSYTPFYSVGDANSLKGANKADILITSDWPANVRTGSKVAFDEERQPKSQQCIAELCSALKPRYHFSLSPDAFFEREPFFHPPEEGDPDGFATTRFLSLAAFGNTSKQKWIYAFSLEPTASRPLQLPPGTTASPFAFSIKKRPLPDQIAQFSRFSQADHSRDRRPSKRKRGQPPPGPGDCFFCLSSPNVATHLITSIGTDAYLTTAKGPLGTNTTFAPDSLPIPAHILIIPLPHSPTLASIPDAAMRQSTAKEMTRYRHSLHEMISAKSQGRLSSVAWEVSRASGVHTHWQFLPVARALVDKGLVEAAFKVEAENEKYPPFESFEPDAAAAELGDERRDCFRVWIGAAQGARGLLLPLDDFYFDLQMGRRVMAKLLGLEARVNWRDCAQAEGEETADADAFREIFKEYDFTLEE